MADRLSASTNSYHTYSLEEALSGIAGAGFTSVELTSVPGWTEHVLRDADDAHLAEVQAMLDRHGLTAVSFSGHSDLTSDDGVEQFRKSLGIARRLGLTKVTTSTGGHDASSEGGLDQQRSEFLKRIGPLCDEAAKDGISICFETHGGLLATGAIAADLMRQINKPNVGINYDPGNVVFYGNTRPETDIAAAAPLVTHMHIKDQIGGAGVWNFPQIGTGEIDYHPIFAELDRVGFDGPCSIEIEFQGEPWPSLDKVNEAMAASYQYVRQFIPKA